MFGDSAKANNSAIAMRSRLTNRGWRHDMRSELVLTEREGAHRVAPSTLAVTNDVITRSQHPLFTHAKPLNEHLATAPTDRHTPHQTHTMPCFRGIDLSVVATSDNSEFPEFPHPDGSSARFGGPHGNRHSGSMFLSPRPPKQGARLSAETQRYADPKISVYIPSAAGKSDVWRIA